jgi:hypothetical protein
MPDRCVTLDGVYQAPGGPDEDRSGGFEQSGWLAPHFDEAGGRVHGRRLPARRSFPLGRKTYELFARYWPKLTDEDNSVASALNRLPKYVASRSRLRGASDDPAHSRRIPRASAVRRWHAFGVQPLRDRAVNCVRPPAPAGGGR